MRIPTNASVSIELIGPADAKEYQDRNTSNRPLREVTVLKYIDDITEGRFKFNGESIIFSNTGRLMNGQHRLEAIIRTGQTLPFVVVRGIEDSAFDTMDQGKNRNIQDIMNIMGTKGGSEIGSTARLVLQFQKNISIRGTGRKPLTQKHIIDFISENKYLIELVDQVKHKRGLLTITPLAAVLFLANKNRLYDAKVAAFLEAIHTGENLTRGQPLYTLREWAIGQRGGHSKAIARELAFPIIARVWSDYMKGKELSVIKQNQIAASKVEIFGYDNFKEITSKIAGMVPSKDAPLEARV